MKDSSKGKYICLHAQILLLVFLAFTGGAYTSQWSTRQALFKPVSNLEAVGESWEDVHSISLGIVLDASDYPVMGTSAGVNMVLTPVPMWEGSNLGNNNTALQSCISCRMGFWLKYYVPLQAYSCGWYIYTADTGMLAVLGRGTSVSSTRETSLGGIKV